jgi:hypothetical protein
LLLPLVVTIVNSAKINKSAEKGYLCRRKC